MGRRTPVGPRPGRRRGVNFTFFPVAAGSSGLLHLVLLCLCATLAADLRCYAQRAPAPAPASAPTLAPAPVTGPLPPPTLLKSELDALRQIYVKLKVPAKTWNFSTNPCDPGSGWGKGRGIDAPVITNLICDCVQNINRRTNVTTNDCRVSSIQLKSQNLTGVLPEELANLTSLAQIDLSRNYLSGSLPASWSTLPLVNLTLLGNRITGSIPEVYGNIKTLNSIVLENNLLNGTLPATLGRLSNLSRLLLSANDFVGEIPVTFAGLTNLTDFRIDGTGISGKIPDFIGKWTQLTRLDVQGTSLKGPFPSSFSNLKQLLQLRITDLEGGSIIPPLDATDLTHLILRNCSLSGEIPVFIGNLKNLKTLDLSFNNLTGQIPSSFDALSALKNVYLTSNALSGSLPSWVSKNKKNIDVSYNSFTGNPPSTCPQGTLNLISSYSSSTSSSAPSCLRKDLPCAGKPKNYKLFINCGGNAVNIDGDEYESDSVALGPSTYFSSSSGDRWAFSSTGDFVGNDQLGYIANNVTALDLTNGTNPALYMQARVNPLSLKYYGLCLQKGNYTVKLHFSEIMFTSDQTYFAVGRRFFDVSIQGKKVLPNYNIAEAAKGTGKAVIESFNATVEDGTLEIHFQWAGKGTNAIPERGVYGSLISAIAIKPNFNPDLGKKELSTGAIVGITVAACVAFFLILLMLLLLWRKKKHEDNEELKGIDFPTGHFTLRQIKAATGNFDPAKKIGEGGFGPVFKGELPDGSLIAVKQLSSKSRQGNREFVNEIGMITALQHPNLVKLFGCCIEANQLLLIYEYLENNSLARALFGPENQRIRLDWQMRGRIAMDIARGLAYLHEESRLKIVHRDIKATNVLLDKDLNAKISDFGLAKLDDEENTHISTRIAGTVGYMAPEYAMRGYLTDKADVYSFGVVLLEIVSGKSNTSYKPKDDFIYLLDWAYVLQERGTLLDLVDPSLGSDYSKEEAERMLRLALICTSPSPSLRPAMTMVVCMLEGTMPVGVPQPKLTRTESEEMRFKTFERLSHDSHVLSTSMDGPWANSSTIMSSSSNGHSAL